MSINLKEMILPKDFLTAFQVDKALDVATLKHYIAKVHANLDKLEASAKKVDTSGEGIWFEQDHHARGQDVETHQALLIGITEIEKKVTKSELIEYLRVLEHNPEIVGAMELADRIEKHGIETQGEMK